MSDRKRKLDVSIEMDGLQREVGSLTGDSEYSARFCYSEDYLNSPFARPISISLPLKEEPFSLEETRGFFEGLLPEGFLRRTVAENNRMDASDYLTLLDILGSECLGAIQIKGADYEAVEPRYKEFDPDTLFALSTEGATRSADLVVKAHLSLTGASGKVGAYLGADDRWYLPIGSAPSTHILKQSHIRYDRIVQNEQLAQITAENLGISVPHSEIVRTHEEIGDGQVLFASERYDRTLEGSVDTISGLPCPLRLHQEDFGQALGIHSAAKYERPGQMFMKRMFDLLRKYSASPIEDQMKLWDMIVFHYLIGNTDGHVKNFSLLYDRNLKSVKLAPAYDVISTIVYDNHSWEMAIAIAGETVWGKIRRETFVDAAREVGINKKIFMERYDDLDSRFERALRDAADEMTAEGFSEAGDIAARILTKTGRQK